MGMMRLSMMTVAMTVEGCAVRPPPPPPPLMSPHRLLEVDSAVASTPIAYPDGTACGIVSSGEWSGMIRDRVDGAHDLVVRGTVGVKPSAMVSISFDPRVQESFPVQRRAYLRAVHPAGPTIDVLEARSVGSSMTYQGALGIVSLMCGTKQIAKFRDPRDVR